MVFFLIDTDVNDVSVYASSESLTGDLEVYDVDEGIYQVYDSQARYLPLTWQARDPRSRWGGQAHLGPPQPGREGRLDDALRRFLPLIGRADLADAAVLDLQAAAQAISEHHGGPLSSPRRPWRRSGKDIR
jgi:predicted exporter